MIFIVYALPKCNTLIQAMLRLIHEIDISFINVPVTITVSVFGPTKVVPS